MHQAEEFQILTKDKTIISATLHVYDYHGPHLIIVCPAAAAPQYYYNAFAKYACENKDFDVVTFDYRGVGKSLVNDIKEETSTMTDWGQKDLAAVIDWADSRYESICLLGHSVAGQIFPKAMNNERILAAYFVGSQSAYFGHWKGIWRLLVKIFWNIILPFTTWLYDYLPGWAMGGNVPISKAAAHEWRSWGLHQDGVMLGNTILQRYFEEVKIRAHFVSIEDDKMFAPTDATRALMYHYKNAVTTFQFIRPKDLKLKRIGHFGFFKKAFAKQLWPLPIMYFSQFVNKFD